jgi:hypothetical protein
VELRFELRCSVNAETAPVGEVEARRAVIMTVLL